jgi:hypothetical protein
MTEVLTTCARCDQEIAVHTDAAILRVDDESGGDAELLFCCPACGSPSVRSIIEETVALLLFLGVEPLRLSELRLHPDDRAPAAPPLTPDDLLTWHEQLTDVCSTRPWEP